MNIILLDTFLKFITLNICICYTYIKIINHHKLLNHEKFNLILLILTFTFLQCFFSLNFSNTMRTLIFYLLYSYSFSKILKTHYSLSIIVTSFSLAICYLNLYFCSLLIFIIFTLLTNIAYTNPIVIIFICILELIFITLLFKIRKIKNGFSFLTKRKQNDYIDTFILVTNIIILFIYFLIENLDTIPLNYLTISLILIFILTIVILQKTFILYQKQKLLNKTLKEYETELAETKSKLETALQEKHNLVKSNHEFYHRQEALKQKLNNLLQSNNNKFLSETSEEYSDILDRINNISEEYTNQIKSRPLLPKTNISELDDMFSYFQSECEKYDIDLILKINADIPYMIETIIPKNKLETLIGDLLRNAIIAINHNNNNNKSIMAILGIKDNCYEFCVHDSGIEFEISTLLKLGTEPASTHLEDGGTGIGFITTFETLNYCNASLIINENISNSSIYTKSIVIKFDNLNKYIINSYRSETISSSNKTRSDIIINNSDK